MEANSKLRIDVNLAYPRAGVVVNVKVETPAGPSDSEAPSFHLVVTDPSTERTVPLTLASSPMLADWARGYSRWLARANVRAAADGSGITGSFIDGLTAQQVLQGVKDACDMIQHRFELYQESVLA